MGNIPQVSWKELAIVWQALWNSVNGNPNGLISLKILQTAAGPEISADTLLGCLRVFTYYSLIKCVSNDAVIPSPEKTSDFNQFRLTGKGNVIGNVLTSDNIK
jgi:hypothetical protein